MEEIDINKLEEIDNLKLEIFEIEKTKEEILLRNILNTRNYFDTYRKPINHSNNILINTQNGSKL